MIRARKATLLLAATPSSYILRLTDNPRLPGPTPWVKPCDPSMELYSSGTHVICGKSSKPGRGWGKGGGGEKGGAEKKLLRVNLSHEQERIDF